MKLYIVVLFVSFSSNVNSQNLVNNWSFEDTVSCPTAGGQIDRTRFWFTPRGGGGNSNLYNACNYYDPIFPGFVGVPINALGFQFPKYGNSYAGISTYFSNSEYREYIETKLFRVLDPSVNYYIEFWVSLANESNYAIENIGAYFSMDTLHYSSNLTTLIDAQVEHSGGIISDTMNWVKVSGYFKPPNEGYRFLTIGNFNVSDSTNKTLVGWHSYDGAHYYIDNVAVIDSALQHTIGFEVPLTEPVEVKVYPNPANSDITLEFSSFLNQNIEIHIYNVMGNLVRNEKRFCQKSVALDVAKLRSGIYFIRVSDESGKLYSEKLIVE